METLVEPARPLSIVGGQLALDFADTVDDPWGPLRFDHIGTVAGLLSWSAQTGSVTSDQARRLERTSRSQPEVARATLTEAHRLRHVVVEVFTEIAADADPAPHHWRSLQPWVTKAMSQAELRAEGDTGRLGWPESDRLEVLLHPVAYAAFQLLTGPDLGRVKRCADCPWLFLDQSKNHSRRWCTMDICGRDHKKALYVARRAERRRRSS